MIAARDRFDVRESRTLQTAGQYQMAHHSCLSQGYCREAHSHLEGNARLFRYHENRATSPDQADESPEQRDNFRRLANEVLTKCMPTAGMGLIAIREAPAAFGTFPGLRLPHRNSLDRTRHDGEL